MNKKYIAIVLLAFTQVTANASQLSGVTVTKVQLHESGGVEWVRIAVDQSNTGPCGNKTQYARENDAIGRAYFSAALSAMAAGKPIKIIGNETCTAAYDSERLSSLAVCTDNNSCE